MCNPIIVQDIDKKGSTLLRHLVSELHHVMGALNMEPSFVDVPAGRLLRDLDRWVDHANDHLYSAIEIISILYEGGFIKEEGGV